MRSLRDKFGPVKLELRYPATSSKDMVLSLVIFNEPSTYMEYITGALWVAASLGVGSIIAACVSAYIARYLKRTEITLNMIDKFLARSAEFQQIIGLLQNQATLQNAANQLQVIEFGNWLETVATLYQRRLVDRQLLKELQIDVQVVDFRDRVKVLGDPFPNILNNYWKSLKDFSP
jgi:hypothetical protein